MLRGAVAPRLDAFSNQRRDHVRGFGIEIVPRTVQVHGQQKDGIEAVLLSISLGLDGENLLGDSVRGIGFFRVSVPEGIFTEGHARELRIGAHSPDGDEFLHLGLARLLHELDAHDGVVVIELPRIFPIGSDPSHDGCEMNHQSWTGVAQHAHNGFFLAQVVFPRPGREHGGSAGSSQLPAYLGTQKTGASRDQNPLILPERHTHAWMAALAIPADLIALRSASTIRATSFLKRVRGSHPRTRRALAAFPTSSSTSDGR